MTISTREAEIITLTPVQSDVADWAIDAVPQRSGIDLVIRLPLGGEDLIFSIAMDREQARSLSDGILKASGDGTQRSFPHPPAEGGDHG